MTFRSCVLTLVVRVCSLFLTLSCFLNRCHSISLSLFQLCPCLAGISFRDSLEVRSSRQYCALQAFAMLFCRREGNASPLALHNVASQAYPTTANDSGRSPVSIQTCCITASSSVPSTSRKQLGSIAVAGAFVPEPGVVIEFVRRQAGMASHLVDRPGKVGKHLGRLQDQYLHGCRDENGGKGLRSSYGWHRFSLRAISYCMRTLAKHAGR